MNSNLFYGLHQVESKKLSNEVVRYIYIKMFRDLTKT